MRDAFENLIEFEKACGHGLPTVAPGQGISDRTYKLRRRLIQEECDELLEALSEHDVPGIADGIADLVYVCLGTATTYGIDLPAVWSVVHAANMRKFGPGSGRDEGGKLQKPPDWAHPDIRGVLARQRPLAEAYGDVARSSGAHD